MRQRGGETLPYVLKSEAQSVVTIGKRVAPESTIYADEAAGWDVLHSRFRRAEIGIHYHIAGPYPQSYSQEMAWREDNRRVSNGEQYLMATEAALRHLVSRVWKGNWQRAAFVGSGLS